MSSRFPAAAPISVALLNYNGEELVRRCARSLQAQTLLPDRLLFIDNGSDRFDEAALRAFFGDRLGRSLSFHRLESNRGYAGGFNAGLERILGDPSAPPWVMTLSNDAELDARFFEHLLPHLGADAGPPDSARRPIGMLAPKLRARDVPSVLDGAGLAISLDGMSTARGQNETDRGQFDAATEVVAPNGVAAVYRVALLRETGLFDTDFGFYCEDTDLGLRGWLAGWECRFVPECVAYHQRSATIGMKSLRKLYLVERNHYWVAAKNFPLPLLLLNPLFTLARFALQLVAVLRGQGQGAVFGRDLGVARLATTTLRAQLAAIARLPRMLVKRRLLAATRRRPLAELIDGLWRKRLPLRDLILKPAPGGDRKQEPHAAAERR